MDRDLFKNTKKVIYLGYSGYTAPCLLAINAVLNSGYLPERATIVTRRRQSHQAEHLFIFWNWEYMPVVVIPSGFASGYGGEGSTGFALAICLIRDKKIPIDGILVKEAEFNALDNGTIVYADGQIFKEIRSGSQLLNWPWPDWVPDDMEELLERGQLWRHSYLLNYDVDSITIAIGDIDKFNPVVGKKLRLAKEKVEKSSDPEDLQTAMMIIRDAWIELAKKLCKVKNVNTTDIKPDAVVDRMKKLGLEKTDEALFNLARASFNLYSKHHKQDIDQDTALAGVISSIVSMKTVLREMEVL